MLISCIHCAASFSDHIMALADALPLSPSLKQLLPVELSIAWIMQFIYFVFFLHMINSITASSSRPLSRDECTGNTRISFLHVHSWGNLLHIPFCTQVLSMSLLSTRKIGILAHKYACIPFLKIWSHMQAVLCVSSSRF